MNLIEFFMILFFSAYYIMPAMQLLYPILSFLTIALIYVVIVLMNEDVQIRKSIIIYIIIFAIYSLFYLLLTDTQTISTSVSSYNLKRFVSKFSQMFILFFPVLLFYRICKQGTKKQLLLLILINSVFIGMVCLNTWNELDVNVNATRSFSLVSENALNNIGSYYFVYIVPFIVVGCIYVMLNIHQQWRYIFIPIILFLFLFLLKSQYTLSVLITIIGSCLLLFQNQSSAFKLLLFPLLIILFLFIPSIIQLAVPYIDSEDMRIRLTEIGYFFSSGNASGENLNGRLSLYWASILAFLHSPIVGNRYLDFDGHSTLLSVLADIGLFGGCFFYYLLFSSRNKIYVLLQSKKTFKIIFFMLICMGLTNPIHSSSQIAWGAWFLLPLLIYYVSISKVQPPC